MERMLEKMAKQLNAYDQSSLMALWQTYATKVKEFEPTKEWEEATLAFCMVQALRWKNQLFNYHLASMAHPDTNTIPPVFLPRAGNAGSSKDTSDTAIAEPAKKATVLRFPNKKNNT